MPVNKGPRFAREDIYIDYPFEEVMYRWDHVAREIHVKFYGADESPKPIPHDNRLFNDALLGGEEISKEQYEGGKGRRK
jgi:hypothetical protein